MHAMTWFERLADREWRAPTASSRRSRRWPRMPSTVFTPLDGEDELVEAGVLAVDGRRSRRPGGRRSRRAFVAHGLPLPPTRARRRPDAPRRAVPLALERVHSVRREDPVATW